MRHKHYQPPIAMPSHLFILSYSSRCPSATKVLGEALDEAQDDVPRALERYTQRRAKDAEALVKLSHGLGELELSPSPLQQ